VLGTLTDILTFDVHQIFDPIRALMVEGKILDWFDYRGIFVDSNMAVLDLVCRVSLVSVAP
jgi:hypothetical protein